MLCLPWQDAHILYRQVVGRTEFPVSNVVEPVATLATLLTGRVFFLSRCLLVSSVALLLFDCLCSC